MKNSSIVIVGAGPGGYTAAFRLADLGFSVTLIDQNDILGGTCLNRGCIPSKALLHIGETLSLIQQAQNFGIDVEVKSLNPEQMRLWKNQILNKLTSGLKHLCSARKINFIQAKAKFLNDTTLELTLPDQSKKNLAFEQLILATGCIANELSFLPKSSRVWDSTKALELPLIPKSLLVIGAGYIGLELGNAYALLGSQVDIIESLPQLLPQLDRNVSNLLLRQFKKTFHQMRFSSKIIKATETPSGIEVLIEDEKQKQQTLVYETVLVCVGRKPTTFDLGLENTSLVLNEKGLVNINQFCQTNHPRIFAIGDITEGPQLAHKASAQAKTVCGFLSHALPSQKSQVIPTVIYTQPEVAICGLTEQQAQEQNKDFIVSQFPWLASGRALTLNQNQGLTKIIADRQTKKILGITIVGIHAGELISECALAIEKELTLEDIEHTIHPHPSLSETLQETAEIALGKPIHFLKTLK